jgi:hypothetical protein
MTARSTILRIWLWPLVHALFIVFGLLSALLGQEGALVWLSWIALTIPLAVIVRSAACSKTTERS